MHLKLKNEVLQMKESLSNSEKKQCIDSLPEQNEKGNYENQKQNEMCSIKINLVPGPKQYRDAHKTSTLIVGDSLISRFTSKQLTQQIDMKNEMVIVNKYPGATTDEIDHYISYQLDKQKPDNLILVVGTNDLLRSKNEGINEFDVVNKIINLGIKARNSGTKEVYISSLLSMAGRYWTNMVTRINNFLKTECFHFKDGGLSLHR